MRLSSVLAIPLVAVAGYSVGVPDARADRPSVEAGAPFFDQEGRSRGLLEPQLAPSDSLDLFRPAPASVLDAELRLRAWAGNETEALKGAAPVERRGVFHRVRLGAKLGLSTLSSYLQLQSSGALGQSGPGEQPLGIGLQQGYVSLQVPGLQGLRVDAGRMALDFGAARQVGRFDFHASGNAFDGIRLGYEVADLLDLHVLAVKIRRNELHPDRERNMTGAYLASRPLERLSSDLYFLYLSDGDSEAVSHLLTMGLRAEVEFSPRLGAEIEGAVQVGDRRPEHGEPREDHLASMLALVLRASTGPTLPRVEFDVHGQYYSSDTDPNDGITSTWRPLYPSLDKVLGLMQLFRQEGIIQAGGRIKVQATERIDAELDGRMSLAPGGGTVPGLGNPALTGSDLRTLGVEVDLRIGWRFLPNSEVAFAGGVFFPAGALRRTTGLDQPAQGLVQWTSQF